MGVDRGNAVDDLADAAGELARGDLALAAEPDQPPAHARYHHALHGDDADGDGAQPEILHDDEDQRRRRLSAEQRRLHEGVADEAAERLDLVLHHAGHFGALHPLEDVRAGSAGCGR